MIENPKVAVMGLRKPLVMAVAVGSQTEMWGRDGVRQYEGHHVMKSYCQVSITAFNSSRSRTSDRDHMYTVQSERL
ncbi:hypothetical protein CTAM01_17275 [Colletotrichum tamarilloi]|uniref:Uncharacterized protein n=1 Tax=Colletotrichum tamarilloi TaxID=1209934 RepID=A0ABQ9QGJ0_9PEZI|nr:uncharacterized protein CTAM01_17275 [Colletotrichum tamarilloi]KAK1452550.1 hypothetical protein CTAM01_17275 [Colletotrichum tamarilloi]